MTKTKVYFVGAGPGNPKLMTVRSLEVLSTVDVVLYDRLVSKEVLRLIPKHVKIIDVGKKPHVKSITQDEIIHKMISFVKDGKTVARLKGGDALFFSRGSEEAEAMKKNGIKFEIVPGVTSATSATAYAGIPLTHRNYSSSVLIATGQERRNKEDGERINWRKVPSSSTDTIVLLMSAEKLQHIANELLNGGLSASTPVAAVRWGTTPKQETMVFTLEEAAMGVRKVRAPSVIVIGKVVDLIHDLNWLGRSILKK